MYWFLRPEKDATMYDILPNQNTGLDEIIEVAKTYYDQTTVDISRALIKFDLTELSSSMVNGNVPTDARMYLNLKISEANEIPLAYTIMVHAASQSWEMGVGTRFDDYTVNGVSWNHRISNDQTTTYWVPIPTGSTYASFAPGTTGSLDGRGGTWYTGSGYETSASFNYTGSDLRVDVTDIVRTWLSGSIDNNGFLLKHTTAVEDDTEDYGSLKWFSKETSTIYGPTLEVAWDNFAWNTGSLTELTASDAVVYIKNLYDEYKIGSRMKLTVGGRARYPQKTFSITSDYLTLQHLPSGSSYYSIIDAEAGDVIVPFGEYSKLSCDSDGNFFFVWTDNMEVERFYRIILKIERSDGTIQFIDNDYIFKLVR